MRSVTLLLTALATVAVANPVPGVAPGANVLQFPAQDRDVWRLDFFQSQWCSGKPDIKISSQNTHSKCLSYNDGLGRELDTIAFMHPYGNQDCMFGCEKCHVNVYYSPVGEDADCCEKHLIHRDWSKKDIGKCINIEPPENHRVRYKVVCDV